MHFLSPHKANLKTYSPIKFEIKIQQEVLVVNYFINIDEVHTSDEFSLNTYDNYGLWDYDVFEIFLTKEPTKLPYLELQVSPKNQTFALLVEKPREITTLPVDLKIMASGAYDKQTFRGEFRIPLTEIPGDGTKIYGNLFACLGPKESRHYFAYNINKEENPDYHRPELFVDLGDLL